MADKLQEVIDKLDEAIQMAYFIEASRERSIAITHMETAELWLRRLKEYEK